jgi:hypothetical protein
VPELERTRELLIELLQLDEFDAQLPLPVIVNLHRAQLRQPMEALFRLGQVRVETQDSMAVENGIWEEMQHRWHHLKGSAYGANTAVSRAYSLVVEASATPSLASVQQACGPNHLGDEFAEVTLSTIDGWQGHDPVALLHRLTWRDAPFAALLAVLEAELATHADVRHMILELAREP